MQVFKRPFGESWSEGQTTGKQETFLDLRECVTVTRVGQMGDKKKEKFSFSLLIVYSYSTQWDKGSLDTDKISDKKQTRNKNYANCVVQNLLRVLLEFISWSTWSSWHKMCWQLLRQRKQCKKLFVRSYNSVAMTSRCAAAKTIDATTSHVYSIKRHYRGRLYEAINV